MSAMMVSLGCGRATVEIPSKNGRDDVTSTRIRTVEKDIFARNFVDKCRGRS